MEGWSECHGVGCLVRSEALRRLNHLPWGLITLNPHPMLSFLILSNGHAILAIFRFRQGLWWLGHEHRRETRCREGIHDQQETLKRRRRLFNPELELFLL